MVTKAFLNRRRILLEYPVDVYLEMPEEPILFSFKYPVSERYVDDLYYRNLKWKSFVKCYFRSYANYDTPVAVLATFYVTPPPEVRLTPTQLKREKTFASQAPELAEYILSLFELIKLSLLKSYNQICITEVRKYYSSNPRTIFRIMSTSVYEQLQNCNSLHTRPKNERTPKQEWGLQPLGERDASDKESSEGDPPVPGRPTIIRPSAGDCALLHPDAALPESAKRVGPYSSSHETT